MESMQMAAARRVRVAAKVVVEARRRRAKKMT
jgi:hypothetical protein